MGNDTFEYNPPTDQLFKPGTKILATEISVDQQSGPVKAWSNSVLKDFESCRYKVFLKKVRKLPDPGNVAANRGKHIHDLAEQYIKGELDKLPSELRKFETSFEDLRQKFIEGSITCEENWGVTIDWERCDWMAPNIWGRAKLDVFEREDKTSARVIDHKTGKKFGNELTHNQQAMVYAIVAFMLHPELDFIKTEFWYLDIGERTKNSYTREQAMQLLPRLKDRATRLTSCQDFYPNPNHHTCKFCPYNRKDGCEWAYQP